MRKISIFLIFFTIFALFLQPLVNKNAYSVKIDDFVNAEAMATIESSTGRILYCKNENEKLPMASTTKIITAIVAIENCDDLDKKHEITKDMTGIEGSSIYLKSGEHLSVKELLYGLMLRSGNDAAVAIAKIIGGSVENFVELMNNFCKQHNLNDTSIVTVNGLHDDNHYTTALDLARVSSYALKNELFAEIASSKEKVISNELDKRYQCRLLKNKNKLLNMIEGADGVKTGYTKKAGKCFVGSATRNGMQVVCAVLNAKNTFDDSAKYINKAFNEFKLVKLFSAGNLCNYSNEIKTQSTPILIKKDIYFPLKFSEISKINAKLNLFKNAKDDNQIGLLDFRIENDLIFSEKIYTINSIDEPKDDFFKKFHKVIRSF